MTFLPIVERELRVASRRAATYWLRTTAALVVLLAGCWVMVVSRLIAQRELAMLLFCCSTGVAALYALMSGAHYTADTLSEEKREGTLGLLFLTDLKGYDVVLGKLVASSVNAFYTVLAVLPMLAIPLLLGGVTPGEFWRMALLALNTLFFSLALGMGVSSICRSAQKSVSLTIIVILFFACGLPAMCGLLAAWGKGYHPVWLLPSPGFAYYRAFDSVGRTNPNLFWQSMVVIHAVGWCAILFASLAAPRSWQDRPANARKQHLRDLWRRWSCGPAGGRAAFRSRLLNENAYYWLASRVPTRPLMVWGVLVLFACGWIWGFIKYRQEWVNEGMHVFVALIVNVLLRSWLAAEAARQLGEDRKSGAMELLLATPLKVSEILRGQWLALRRQFLGPVIAVLAVETCFMADCVSRNPGGSDRAFWVFLWLGGMVMLVADLVALYWVAMWLALTARNPNQAAGQSLGRILVLPWLLYALVMSGVTLGAVRWLIFGSALSWAYPLGLWFILGIGTDLVFAAYARRMLHERFRLAAARRYEAPKGFWKGLFG